MKIHIAHLYYDLLNLYGENGNVKALKNILEKDNDVYVHFYTIDDEIDFDKIDFIYIGMGTEKNLHIALSHLLKYKKQIKKYIDEGKFILATGNSFEMFGKYIEYENEKIPALDIFDYYTKSTEKRIVKDQLYKCSLIKKDIIGFENRGSQTFGDLNFIEDGCTYKNFYGTYLIGPILVRNPELLKYMASKLTNKKIKAKLNFEEKAYDKKITQN